jgi:hypothetical protein
MGACSVARKCTTDWVKAAVTAWMHAGGWGQCLGGTHDWDMGGITCVSSLRGCRGSQRVGVLSDFVVWLTKRRSGCVFSGAEEAGTSMATWKAACVIVVLEALVRGCLLCRQCRQCIRQSGVWFNIRSAPCRRRVGGRNAGA